MANTYLSRSVSSNGNRQKFTISMWIKKSPILSSTQYIFTQGSDDNNNFSMYFDSANQFGVWDYGSGYNGRLASTRRFADTNGWYHIVVRVDTTLATADDRMRFYVNGVQETDFGTRVNFSQNFNTHVNQSGNAVRLGYYTSGSGYFDGYMSHVHLCDGYSYGPDSFGQTDATTGEWKINTSPNVSYGTNGFWWLKDNANTTDNSPNSNTFTVANGTLTKSEDNPSNVFATINPLLGSDVIGSTVNFSNGNTTAEDPNGSASGINPIFMSSLGMPSKGKWYCEVQPSSFSTSSGHSIGLVRTKGATDDSVVGGNTNKLRYIFADTAYYIIKYGTNDQTGLSAISSGATVGLALDLDNGTFQYYVDGSARANQITGINSANDGYDYFFMMDLESSSSGRYGLAKFNFGNGAFANTQLTGTTYTDSEGFGTFKYQPPTGYLAWCTKNLNE
mgnify:CR=1 FL=1